MWLRSRPRVLPRAEPEPDREAEGEAHPDRHRLAMDEPGGVVAGHALERVREGVAEVEQRPLAVLALVADDDRGLRPAALGDGVVALRPAGEDPAPVRLAPFEEALVADEPVFHHLGIAGAHLAQRQRVERGGVGEDEARLMEGADEVLAVARIDAGLAADRGIDLGQERRRHLHEAHAAPHDRGGETGEIADDAAAERHDEIAALDARIEDRVANPRQRGVRSSRLRPARP